MKNNIIKSTMQIINQCRQPILGATDSEHLNIVKRINAVVTDSVTNVRPKYPELFSGQFARRTLFCFERRYYTSY